MKTKDILKKEIKEGTTSPEDVLLDLLFDIRSLAYAQLKEQRERALKTNNIKQTN